MRWMVLGSMAAVSLVFAARAVNFSRGDFHLNFSGPGTQIQIRQEIVGPDIAGPGIVGPDRLETVGIVACTSHTLRVTFSTTSTAGADVAQGVALAALL